MATLENALPTRRSSGSFTVSRRSAVAASFVAGSSWSVRRSWARANANASRPPGMADHTCSSSNAALASMSSPVSATVNVLR